MREAPLIEQMAVVYATQIEEQQAEIERLTAENAKMRAALERLETASGSGEISGSLFKQGEGFVFVGEYIRAALNEETK